MLDRLDWHWGKRDAKRALLCSRLPLCRSTSTTAAPVLHVDMTLASGQADERPCKESCRPASCEFGPLLTRSGRHLDSC